MRQATKTAMAMACSYGMDEELGLAVLDGEYGGGPDVRRRVNQILNQEMKKAVALVREHKPLVDKLVEVLLKKNKLSGKEVQEVFRSGMEG